MKLNRIFILNVFLLFSCVKQNITEESKHILEASIENKKNEHQTKSASSVQLINDSNFQRGFSVLDPNTGDTQGILQINVTSNQPDWNLAQWYSEESLFNASPTILPSGSYHFANSYKAVTIGPSNSADRDLVFAINGQNEFNGNYRGVSDPFPHLLADQRIADPDGWLGGQTPFLGEISSMEFNIDALLKYHSRNQQNGYNSDIHALQFSFVFLIQNLRQGNSGYGENMYFLIMLFDDRFTQPIPSIQEDIFSGKLIYNVGLPFTSSGLTQDVWKNINGDLLPLIKNGLDEAWNRNLLTASTDYNDYKLSMFTMGFECTGLNIGTMQVKNLSLTANLN